MIKHRKVIGVGLRLGLSGLVLLAVLVAAMLTLFERQLKVSLERSVFNLAVEEGNRVIAEVQPVFARATLAAKLLAERAAEGLAEGAVIEMPVLAAESASEPSIVNLQLHRAAQDAAPLTWARDARGRIVGHGVAQPATALGSGLWNMLAELPAGRCYWQPPRQALLPCLMAVRNGPELVAVVQVDVSLDALATAMQRLPLASNGYLALLDLRNRVLVAPAEAPMRLGEPLPTSFADVNALLTKLDEKLLAPVEQGLFHEPERLRRLAATAENVTYEDARMLAATLADPLNGFAQQGRVLDAVRLDHDPILQRNAGLSVFHVPGLYFKLLLSAPLNVSGGWAEAMLTRMSVAAMVIAAAVLLLGFLVTYWLLSRPLAQMTRRLRKQAESDEPDDEHPFSPPMVARSDELGELAYWCNQRSVRLQQTEAALRESNEVLQGETANREAVQQALDVAEAHAAVLLASIRDAVVATDSDLCVEYANPVACTVLGASLGQLRGRLLSDCVDLVGPSGLLAQHALECREAGLPQELPRGLELLAQGGKQLPIEGSLAPIITEQSDGATGVILVFRDLSHAHALTAALKQRSERDMLTGLPNRQNFHQQLDDAIGDLLPQGLVYIDLDQFKLVNETAGHLAGDELVKQLGRCLRHCLRTSDLLARTGGDEFAVLLRECRPEHVVAVAEKLRAAVENMAFTWEGQSYKVTVSLGVVSFDETATDAGELLKQADAAGYRAKQKGRNRVHIYQSDDAEMQAHFGDLHWVGEIHGALRDNRFVLHAQRIQTLVSTGDQGLHFEVLLRMFDSGGKFVPPGLFLGAAERYGLGPKIDRWVVEHTIGWLESLGDDLSQVSKCAINLSGSSMADATFPAILTAAISASSVPPEKLCFEITETAAISNLSDALRLIGELKALGCRLALDDFGAGMSSFGYLKNLPVDYLKIDGSFVGSMASDEIDYAMVKSINEIGQTMDKITIAEFVEDEKIVACLKELGVNFGQGYFFDKPSPIEELFPGSAVPGPGAPVVHGKVVNG